MLKLVCLAQLSVLLVVLVVVVQENRMLLLFSILCRMKCIELTRMQLLLWNQKSTTRTLTFMMREKKLLPSKIISGLTHVNAVSKVMNDETAKFSPKSRVSEI